MFARNFARRFFSQSARSGGGFRTTARATVALGSSLLIASGAFAWWSLLDNAHESPLRRIAFAKEPQVDYNAVRKDIAKILDNEKYDDGSYGPILVRLAWHASGTYNKNDGTGGSSGAKMRFPPEKDHGANAGLHIARQILEPIKAKYPGLSYADLWTLAGVVAIEEMGGPKIAWRSGRTDESDGKACTPPDRLPDADKGADHIRAVFGRMGFDDRETVALLGAHALGRCHKDRSGYEGPWTRSPITVSNAYFTELLNPGWAKKKWGGPEQFEDPSKELMMLPADMALLKDPEYRKYVDLYAKDEDLWLKDFGLAFGKLMELGVKFPPESKPAGGEGGIFSAITSFFGGGK